MNKKLIIVVPWYNEHLSPSEELSMKSLLRNTGEIDIRYISPERLTGRCNTITFPDRYFESIHTYSELMLSKVFWEAFKDYDYMLIHQLDCLLLRDNLLEWCEAGFDYIGAPWMANYAEEGDKFVTVGNGGFSLRNIQKHLDVFKVVGDVIQVPPGTHEDTVWSQIVPQQLSFLNFKVACPEVAKYFAVETGVELNRELLKGKYPSGVHAWEKREAEYFRGLLCY